MDALKPENERNLLEEIDKLKSTTIDLQAAVIELLRRGNGEEQPSRELVVERKANAIPPLAGTMEQEVSFDAKSHRHTTLVFENTELSVVDHQGRHWITLYDLASALYGVDQTDATLTRKVNRVYLRHADEFNVDMTVLVEMETLGGRQKVRVFSPRGCHLIGMFARTRRSKTFRRGVLDVLDKLADPQIDTKVPSTVVAPTTGEPTADPFQGCGVHAAEFLAFLAVTRGRMGGSRKMSEQVSIHTALVLRWLWYRCLDEELWYEASRPQMARDLGMYHTTALRCMRRIEDWGFVEQRIMWNRNATECRLLRSVIEPDLVKAGAFRLTGGTGLQIGSLPEPDTRPALLPSGHFTGADLGDLANVAGSAAAAMFLAKALEFQGLASAKNGGWWAKSRDEWTKETGLSGREQVTARKKLRKAGILIEERRGVPAAIWYWVDREALVRLIRQRKRAALGEEVRAWH